MKPGKSIEQKQVSDDCCNVKMRHYKIETWVVVVITHNIHFPSRGTTHATMGNFLKFKFSFHDLLTPRKSNTEFSCFSPLLILFLQHAIIPHPHSYTFDSKFGRYFLLLSQIRAMLFNVLKWKVLVKTKMLQLWKQSDHGFEIDFRAKFICCHRYI